jgi:hypothetical protein
MPALPKPKYLEPPRPVYVLASFVFVSDGVTIETGKVVAATYDRKVFEIIAPYTAVIRPITYVVYAILDDSSALNSISLGL